MGCSVTVRCGRHLIADGREQRQSGRMTDHHATAPGVLLSAADHAELMRELHDLRSRRMLRVLDVVPSRADATAEAA